MRVTEGHGDGLREEAGRGRYETVDSRRRASHVKLGGGGNYFSCTQRKERLTVKI